MGILYTILFILEMILLELSILKVKVILITKVVVVVVEEGGSSTVFGSSSGRWVFRGSSSSRRIFPGIR